MAIIYYPSEQRYVGLSTDSWSTTLQKGAKAYFTDTKNIQICDGTTWSDYIPKVNSLITSLPALPAGTNNIGTVGVTSLPALPAGTNNIGTVNTQSLSGIVLNVASAAITVTTASADLTVGNYKELAVDINISAVSGTSPTYQLMVDRLGVDGIYYNIYTGTSITAVGVISINLGVGASTNVSFGNVIRVREIVGGTTPSFTRSTSIIGK